LTVLGLILIETTNQAMNYRAIVTSDRTEDRTADSLQKACELAAMLSDEFGWVDVTRNVCGPEPILATYNNGHAA
jgi:hypothetical protein